MPTIRQLVLEKMAREWLPLDKTKNTSNEYINRWNLMSERQRKTETRNVRVTWYNKTGNPMSNWLYPKEWYVATSDRTIPLGSWVVIDWKKYKVGDRTAKWVHDKKWDTVDIFYDEPKEKTIKRWAQQKEVKIIYND